MQIDRGRLYTDAKVGFDFIVTLVRFGIGSKNTSDWGYLGTHDMEDALHTISKRIQIKEQKLAGVLEAQSPFNTINTKKVYWEEITVTAVGIASNSVQVAIDELYYADEYTYYDDKQEIADLVNLDLHHQFHQPNPTPNIFGPRCRCQSPSSFAVDSS